MAVFLSKSGKDGQLRLETTATLYNNEAGTNSGDNKKFTYSGTFFSMLEDDGTGTSRQPVVVVDGQKTGGKIIPAISLANDKVDVAAATVNLAGVNVAVSASVDLALTRGATLANTWHSVQVNSSGTIVMVDGTEIATALLTTRGTSAGQIPYVAVGSIELGLIKILGNTPAPVVASEITNDPEKSFEPGYNLVLEEAAVDFLTALVAIHTGDVTRAVHATHYDPTFVTLSGVSEFGPPDKSLTATDETTYDGISTSITKGRNTGSFDALLTGLPGDPVLQNANGIRVMKFFPDRFKTEHQLMWASYSTTRTYPAAGAMKASCSLIAITDIIEKSS